MPASNYTMRLVYVLHIEIAPVTYATLFNTVRRMVLKRRYDCGKLQREVVA